VSDKPKKGVSKGTVEKVTINNEGNIFREVLTDQENAIWDNLSVDVATQMDYDIKILTIRERRMLERIKKLEECAFMEVRIQDTAGKAGNRKHTQRVVISEASLVMIQQIEAELTRIQEKKARMIEVKHKYEVTLQSSDTADVQPFITALTASIDEVWDDEEVDGESDGDTQSEES
jgi:hypothetical protein